VQIFGLRIGFSTVERQLLQSLQTLTTKVVHMSEQLDSLNTKVDTLGAKVAGLEAGYDQVTDALKALQAAGGATPEDLSAVIAKIDAITSGVDADAARNAQPPATPTT
jgi:outer membrane murein-binding lipoprotein Lpp